MEVEGGIAWEVWMPEGRSDEGVEARLSLVLRVDTVSRLL